MARFFWTKAAYEAGANDQWIQFGMTDREPFCFWHLQYGPDNPCGGCVEHLIELKVPIEIVDQETLGVVCDWLLERGYLEVE